jgi:hypothetical protein
MKHVSPPRRWASAALVAGLVVTLAGAPASAHGGGLEYLHVGMGPYLESRMHEVADPNSVLLALEWTPTVDGRVLGARICLDLTQQEVNRRLPLYTYLWKADGTRLARGRAAEGIVNSAPCFYTVSFAEVPVQAGERYVVGFWLRAGQYSFVWHGLDQQVSNLATGHLIGVASYSASAGTGNGLYAYTANGSDAPFPTESWENVDYLVSPEFIPNGHP